MDRTAASKPRPSTDVRTTILVTGPPGSGKSTLAEALAHELGFPLIDKDVIKEALFEELGTGNRDWSRTLSRASFRIMIELARRLDASILVGNFSAVSAPGVMELSPAPIEIFCRCPTEELVRRIKARKRHRGHLDDVTVREVQRGTPSSQPLGLGGPFLEVDTSRVVEADGVIDWVRTAGL